MYNPRTAHQLGCKSGGIIYIELVPAKKEKRLSAKVGFKSTYMYMYNSERVQTCICTRPDIKSRQLSTLADMNLNNFLHMRI